MKLLAVLVTLVLFAVHAANTTPAAMENSQEERAVQFSQSSRANRSIRFATFNVSMEATNYQRETPSANVLEMELASGTNVQIKNVAEIIQRVQADILLLNEFDLLPEETGINAFKRNYLEKGQSGQLAVHYPYHYVGTVNTGIPSPYDFNNDGVKSGYGADAFGFGLYEGQYGMVLLSKYPIQIDKIRTFQHFKWKDMPNYHQVLHPDTQQPWYDEDAWNAFRLSSKSHWDIPVMIAGHIIHVLAMHPTPPAFDGEEDRNGKRNHDEIRFFADYIDPNKGDYIYDDNGNLGGLGTNVISANVASLQQGLQPELLSQLQSQSQAHEQIRFVLLGDFNAADSGPKHRPGVIEQLTEHPLINNSLIPTSEGGAESDQAEFSNRYTAYWGARADYVLASRYGFDVVDAGVFWPSKQDPLFRLVKSRQASSDHRMVWLDVRL